MRLSVVPYLLCFVGYATGAAIQARVQQPANDPFYTPPADWQNTSPGTILATRKVLAAAFGLLPTASVTTYQLLYRTQDQDGNPLATVTTIFVPLLHSKDRLLSFAVAEDSAASKCAPSYQYQLGSDSSNTLAQLELILIQVALAQGWIVTVADYQGPASAWIAGRLEGRAVLDSLRATRAFSALDLTSDAKLAMWGYSGGAAAVGWAAALKANYAPELNIVGVAQGGTPANLTAAALYLNKGSSSGCEFQSGVGVADPPVIAVSFYGLGAAYPAFKAKLDSVATPRYGAVTDFVTSNCAIDVLLKYPNQDFFVDGVYFNGGETLLEEPTAIRPVLDSLILGNEGPSETPMMPMLVYHAQNDQILPYGPAVKMVDSYCANGANLQFVTNTDPSVGHILEEVLTIPRSIAFLTDRFNGKAMSGGCSDLKVGISTVTDAVAEALQRGLPGLAPLIGAAVAAAKALPAI